MGCRHDLHNNIKVSRAISPAAAITGNGNTDSQIIDTKGFESLEFVILAGALTDGTLTPQLIEGDDSGLSDGATVAAGDLLGSATAIASTDDNAVRKIGYRGNKRYVRLRLVQTGATSGGFAGAVAVQANAGTYPVS
ncbi:MAG TPA: hypothetical protein VF156_15375 [Agromyces sp.]